MLVSQVCACWICQGSTIIGQRVAAQYEDPVILLPRNYLSIGALKRQMVTVQKNEEALCAPSGTILGRGP